jgi:dTDP-4-amino-4,6-dideoxygalactose transaminase
MRSEIYEAIERVVESQHFILGPEVERFEEELARYCGTRHAVAVSSGTDALLASLMACEIGPGDEVIVPSYSFVASASCISRLGATPVFVDICISDYNINANHIEAAITDKTKAIIPVHFAGQMADMDRIMLLAAAYGLVVIEDACQAIGASQHYKKAGSIGDMGCFSFFPTKNLGGYGDGGAIVTNDWCLYNKLMMIRNHGQKQKYYSRVLGGNFRMDEIQAAVLNAKFPYLDSWNAWRRRNAETYNKRLINSEVLDYPFEEIGNHHIYHLYIVGAQNEQSRGAMIKHLRDSGVDTGIYYPMSLPDQWIFPGVSGDDFPSARYASRTTIALPMRPYQFTRQINTICDIIEELS